jgi:hypothetical protein
VPLLTILTVKFASVLLVVVAIGSVRNSAEPTITLQLDRCRVVLVIAVFGVVKRVKGVDVALAADPFILVVIFSFEIGGLLFHPEGLRFGRCGGLALRLQAGA